MPIETIEHIEIAAVVGPLQRRDMSLWVLPGVCSEDLSHLLRLPWTNIWDAASELDVETLWSAAGDNRHPLRVSRPEQDHPNFRASEFVRIYDTSPKAERRGQRFVDRLKDRVEEATGLLCFVGAVGEHWDDVSLARDLAPGLTIIFIDVGGGSLPPEPLGDLYRWDRDAGAFAQACAEITKAARDPWIANIKDAPGLHVDRRLLEDISQYWTFLGSSLTTKPKKISQDEFDAFLNVDDAWQTYAAGAPYRRLNACFRPGEETDRSAAGDFVAEAMAKAFKLERAHLSPNEQLEQMLLFCEPGSGATTLLRQTAMELAHYGFPTLVTKPFPQSFGGRSLEQFIVDVQDRWLSQRRGKGSGAGMIPVCLVIDTDGEAATGEQGLPRALQSLGRKVLLVRAMERSQDEIEEATGIYTLGAEVDSEEMVALGAHLRVFAQTQGLAQLPSDDEWRAFHEGITRVGRYAPAHPDAGDFSTPSLFLIGIYPFVKERISDENSLEQYYYRKWRELGDENAEELVRVLAAAGVYGLSVPFDTLRRHPGIDVLQVNGLDKRAQRIVDIFVRWIQYGHSTVGWYLYMRHAAIASLLSRAIDPSESNFPYSAILPLLENLSTKEEDLWFAGTIAYRLGQQFKSRSPRFSLETDTAAQRAARAVFNAIPEAVKSMSRTVRHHEGRYHLHVLRACTECLRDPKLTVLPQDEVLGIAKLEFERATEYLNLATETQGEGEPLSNIFNTLATAHFVLAEALQGPEPAVEPNVFDDALDYGDRALKHDPANGHALFQYVQRVVEAVKSSPDGNIDRHVELLCRAELRIVELIRLHEEKRWRNIDPIEAEKQLGSLVQDYLSVVETLTGVAGEVAAFHATQPEAVIFLRVRTLVGERSLEGAFRDQASSQRLRDLRAELAGVLPRSSKSDVYLYRLFLADPEGRVEYKMRLELLQKLKRDDPEQFAPFRHDEAALYCQIDQLDIGERKLREIREYRRNDRTQWFWLNERALLESGGSNRPREIVLEVHDPAGGWALVRGTDIRVKYQPYQFGEMTRRQVFRAFIRFTLNGLQAVPEPLIHHDLTEMGLA